MKYLSVSKNPLIKSWGVQVWASRRKVTVTLHLYWVEVTVKFRSE